MKKKLLLFLFSVFISHLLVSNTCTSNAGTFASWAAITWTCTSIPTSGPPTCGDVMNVGASTTVNVSADVDYSGCASPITLNIYGTMNFNVNGVRFRLPAGSTVFVASGGSINKTFPGGGSSTLISIGGVNVWTAGSGNITGPITLAIELLSFTAKPNLNTILLNWTTATEENNDFFTIDKTRDGVNFEYVGTVDGAGSSTSVLHYSLVDHFPWEGLTYYRLKQTDFNGLFAFFEMVAVDFNKFGSFSFDVYPNPNSGDNITISMTSQSAQEVTVVIHDVLGNEIFTNEVHTEKQNEFKLYTATPLVAGVYMISVYTPETVLTKRLIIK